MIFSPSYHSTFVSNRHSPPRTMPTDRRRLVKEGPTSGGVHCSFFAFPQGARSQNFRHFEFPSERSFLQKLEPSCSRARNIIPNLHYLTILVGVRECSLSMDAVHNECWTYTYSQIIEFLSSLSGVRTLDALLHDEGNGPLALITKHSLVASNVNWTPTPREVLLSNRENSK